jgi:hypothetical protein
MSKQIPGRTKLSRDEGGNFFTLPYLIELAARIAAGFHPSLPEFSHASRTKCAISPLPEKYAKNLGA